MDIFVGPERVIEARTFDKPYVLISISSRPAAGWTQAPLQLQDDPNRLAVLFIRFDDCSPKDRRVARPLLKKEAREIWRFFQHWQDQIELLVVNCEAGMSRSPAVATAILTSLDQSAEQFRRPPYQLNSYVKTVMLATHPAGDLRLPKGFRNAS